MKRRVAKKRASRSEREWIRLIKRSAGQHDWATMLHFDLEATEHLFRVPNSTMEPKE
jgi:hypothetical protein